RARLLHAMSTNQVEALKPGEGCYAFFLTAQGRILGDANLLCQADQFLIDTEPETADSLAAHIDQHIIADDVTLEDLRGATCAIAIEGPRAAETLAVLGAPVPQAAFAHCPWADRIVAALSVTGQPGYRVFAPATGKLALIAQIESAGAAAASPEAIHAVRLESGRPRYGEDISTANLAQETQLDTALNFNKGCYLGQEIVERVRSRGHVNRLLVRLAMERSELPAPGAAILSGAATVGAITSAAFSPTLGRVLALGYVRTDLASEGTVLDVDGSRAEIIASRPD
ncbi:MAG: glycine cleavage T C-terminal barrel domain-containing protein, partial [Bryobacteraceae bacterium]